MATIEDRYIVSTHIELRKMGQEGDLPMWTLDNVYNHLDYEEVIVLEEKLAEFGRELNKIGRSKAEELKKKDR
jgi:hypothetical protein